MCNWTLLTGPNAGKKCPKKPVRGQFFCDAHLTKGRELEEIVRKKKLDEEYLQKHGMTYKEYSAKILQEEKERIEKEDREFRLAHDGKSQIEVSIEREAEKKAYIQKLREEEEKKRKEKVLERIRNEPNFQLNEMTRDIQKYLEGYFDPNDGYMDSVRYILVEATPNGIITLSDGRKFKVGLIEITD